MLEVVELFDKPVSFHARGVAHNDRNAHFFDAPLCQSERNPQQFHDFFARVSLERGLPSRGERGFYPFFPLFFRFFSGLGFQFSRGFRGNLALFLQFSP